MVTVCQQCGDRGFSEALIDCKKCQTTAVHLYCMYLLPESFDEDLIWYCEDCEPKVAKPSALDSLSSPMPGKCDSENLGIVQANGAGLRSKKKAVKQSKKNKPKRRGFGGSLAKPEVNKCENSSRYDLEVHCSENQEKDQIFRRQKELDGMSFYEEAESANTKTSVTASRDPKSDPEYSCELRCSESERNNEELGRQIGFDGSSYGEESESVKTRSSRIVTSDLPNTPQCSFKTHKEPNLGVHFSGNKKKGKKFRKWRKLARKISDSEIESVKTSPVATNNPLSIPKYTSNACEISIVEVYPNLRVQFSGNEKKGKKFRRWRKLARKISDPEIESVKTSPVVTNNPSSIPNYTSDACEMSVVEVQCNEIGEKEQRLIRWMGSDGGSSNGELETSKSSNIPRHGCHISAQPIVEPIWRGNLRVHNFKHDIIEGLVAHLSTSACSKVFQEAKLLPELLCPELLPRYSAWPRSFHQWGPNDDHIALYLFPNNERAEKIYDRLVYEMINQDLAMRAVVKNAELLLFTSKLLPPRLWRYPTKFYLWGVFRGKQASQSRASALYSLNPISVAEPKNLVYALTWHANSPISPLSNSGNAL
ncbi:RING/FYVE/PHD zinc finger superfamily protein [Melia azedarach]|uniref:RING/FYVE/PHD zinc finger superfamily protein n=1 Tax=Melia azedarach TaxID=155640 RepID=A0ACC1WPA2_MELAZ|nr:RING/FYVE/PHD zinc finger superfamily protein [Melia azedarach]